MPGVTTFRALGKITSASLYLATVQNYTPPSEERGKERAEESHSTSRVTSESQKFTKVTSESHKPRGVADAGVRRR